ncbi:restriction endonuclease [Acidaminococcus sp. LBK-2]|uniref:restriction endonuclease n=1 Tax=Acidaminococcus sp. LBK-2 TaxID=3456956 RepID=UPI003FA4A4E0
MIDYVKNISASGLTIYDLISHDNSQLYIPTKNLEALLSNSIIGLSLNGLPLRTRSKVVKQAICHALGYPIPKSFKKTQPRFPGQNFDVYTQKSLNVQIWNEDVEINRRYVFLRVNNQDIVTKVKIITGKQLILLDHTGTFTQKYQARMCSYDNNICSNSDSPTVNQWAKATSSTNLHSVNPNALPQSNMLLKISEVYRRLLPILGMSVSHLDAIQERNRGAELHALICEHLGYSIFEDDGSYPDIINQLIEIKLQTSPTIDLGLHSPEDGHEILRTDSMFFYSDDIRYVILDGDVQGDRVVLKHLYLVSGKDFSTYFPLFQGKILNKKLQIPLPSNFFDS